MSARNAAAKVQPGSTVRWDRLERAALSEHQSVLDKVWPSLDKKVHKFWAWNLLWAIPVVILYLACYFAPVWGAAAMGVHAPFIGGAAPDMDPEQAIPLAGIFYVIAVVMSLISFVHWLITGRRRNGFYQVQAWLVLVFGALTALRVTYKGERDSVESWQMWLIPVGAAVVFAAIVLVFHLVASLSRDVRMESNSQSSASAEADLPPNKLELFQQRREQVARLSDAERAALRLDIDAAINELAHRGVITEAEAERARDAELGALALRMWRAPGQ